MSAAGPGDADPAAVIAELRAELDRLRRHVARLEAEKAAILAAQAARDYERPPHYQ